MVHVEDRGEVRLLRMAHGKVQAMDVELLTDLQQAFDGAERDGVGAVVLTGTGGSFSAGVDLVRLVDGGAEYVGRFLPLLSAALVRLFRFGRPLVTAVNGHAIAGGAIVAWCGDVRLMADGPGRIGVPELRVGVPFPVAALELVRFAVGRRAEELLFRARTYDASEAEALGLVDETVGADRLVDVAVERARELAALPATAFSLAKDALRRPTLDRIERYAGAIDSQVTATWAAAETHERIREYLQRTVRAGR